MTSTVTDPVGMKPLRVIGLVLGGLLMLFSLGAWFPYVGSSIHDLRIGESGPGVTNQDIVEAFFGFWLLLWVPGLLAVLLGAHRWLRRTFWSVIILTAAMIVVSGITALIGISTNQ